MDHDSRPSLNHDSALPPTTGRWFDASSDPVAKQPDKTSGDASQLDRPRRPFIGIQFQCCRTYARIYRNAEMTAYVGNCPRCAGRIEVPIRHGGGSARFFSAG